MASTLEQILDVKVILQIIECKVDYSDIGFTGLWEQ